MPSKKATALVVLFNGVEEVEALTPVDILRRANVEVTIAGLENEQTVLGKNQIILTPECSLNSVIDSEFDLFLIPGGPGVFDLLDNSTLRRILQKRASNEQLSAAICAAPKVLALAGIIDNIAATGHASIRASLPKPSEETTVVTPHIITSQGVGTAIEFSLELVKRLIDEETANEIAKSIHFD